MDWLLTIIHSNPVGETVLILSLTAGVGLFLGSIRFFGIGLEIAGVLFAGLLFSYLGMSAEPAVIDFLRDFGLVLFVYSVGIQVGPGFASSFKRDGLRLNILAATVVFSGAIIAILIHFIGGVEMPIAVGLFSGATTNTPSLAAAQQALKDIPGVLEETTKMPSIGYAVAYPFGIIGIILTMILTQRIFRIEVSRELLEHSKIHETQKVGIEAVNLILKNPNLNGRKISELPKLNEDLVISRIKHGKEISIAKPDTLVYVGDILLAVGARKALEELRLMVGDWSDEDLRDDENITSKRVVVTKKAVAGKTIMALHLLTRYGVTITRVVRRDVEMPVSSDLLLEFGDVVVCVGLKENLEKAAVELGNTPRALDHPQLIPVFLGIVLGVILGSIPFYLPGVPAPVRLGLAGGPLLVSICLSRIRRTGSIIWHMPHSANFMMREIGIVLFLACVGLKSGNQFVTMIVSGEGLRLMLLGALITFVPIFIVAMVSRLFFKINFMTLCGLLAGSMTDPPALAFANTMATSSAPSVSYASVYPLVMILRVLCAQILVLFFIR